TNLFYNYHRDYDPQTGRYIQSDPIGLNGGMNTYSYVDSDPVTKVDPLGLATKLCKGSPDTYKHMWVCGDGYCHGYMPTVDPSASAAKSILKEITVGVPGEWISHPLKTHDKKEYCEPIDPPSIAKKCDMPKFDKCMKDKTTPRISGTYQVPTNMCIHETQSAITECLIRACPL
ncbi:RHS repeat-associated core domain-containing protein, partial [Massilia scottii]|uniref:RHS repeat-associated core domain-containing protein n=1 Tax=Massilia scottii TaxID=3057166 RepID=UPI002796B2A2